MRQFPANGRIITFFLVLMLGVVTYSSAAPVFFEQHETLREPILPQLRVDPTQVVLNLAGSWEATVNGEKTPMQTWLPGDFWSEGEDVEYRRTFRLDDSLRKWNFQLFLPEIQYHVQIWMNGRLVSSFTGSHLGFSCDIGRDLLKFDDENEIILKLSSKLSPLSTLPLMPQLLQPRNYAGFSSGVYLRGVPQWSIEEARIARPSDRPGAESAVDVNVRIAHYIPTLTANDSAGSTQATQLYVSLKDSTGGVVADARRDLTARGTEEEFQIAVPLATAALKPWSPEIPTLYDLSAALIAGDDTLHRISQAVGFKRLEIRGGDFYLNGVRLRARGMDYVIEHPDGGRAVSETQLKHDLKAMKDLGINIVRVPFGPPPPKLLDLADRAGFLLLVEAGIDGTPAAVLANGKYRELCQQAFERLTESYGGHVSVLGWGIGSQLDWQHPEVQQFEEWMRSVVWAHDSHPCYIETADATQTGPADFVLVGDITDVTGAEFDVPDRKDLPVMLSRVGKLVSPNDPTGSHVSAGLVNQAEYLIRRINGANETESLDGYILHSFADYHGASPLFIQPQFSDPYLYGFGIVSFNRTERVSYFKLRDLVQTGQASPSVPTTAGTATPLVFPIVGLAALLVVSIEMRRNNVFRQNIKRVFLHPHGFHMDLRYRRFLHTAQPLLLWLLEAVTMSLVVVSILYALRDNVVFDYYLTHFVPSADLKASLIKLIWNSTNAVLFFTAVFLGLTVIFTLIIRLMSIPFRERMDLWQAANYVVWSYAAVLFILPVGAILFRLLDTPEFVRPSIVLVAGAVLWSIQRLLGALRIGLGTSAWRVYLTVVVVLGLVIFGGAALLNHELGTFAYWDQFHGVLRPH